MQKLWILRAECKGLEHLGILVSMGREAALELIPRRHWESTVLHWGPVFVSINGCNHASLEDVVKMTWNYTLCGIGLPQGLLLGGSTHWGGCWPDSLHSGVICVSVSQGFSRRLIIRITRVLSNTGTPSTRYLGPSGPLIHSDLQRWAQHSIIVKGSLVLLLIPHNVWEPLHFWSRQKWFEGLNILAIY